VNDSSFCLLFDFFSQQPTASGQIIGTWFNQAPETPGITKVVFSNREDKLIVHAWEFVSQEIAIRTKLRSPSFKVSPPQHSTWDLQEMSQGAAEKCSRLCPTHNQIESFVEPPS
jgi:hypothetical protein